MKNIIRWLIITAAVYCALWGATAVWGGRILERQLSVDLQKEWRSSRDEAEAKREMVPGSRDRIAYPHGPRLKVQALSCPAPFVIDAEVERTIGGLNGRGAVGRYLVTPWRTYILSEHRTWVS